MIAFAVCVMMIPVSVHTETSNPGHLRGMAWCDGGERPAPSVLEDRMVSFNDACEVIRWLQATILEESERLAFQVSPEAAARRAELIASGRVLRNPDRLDETALIERWRANAEHGVYIAWLIGNEVNEAPGVLSAPFGARGPEYSAEERARVDLEGPPPWEAEHNGEVRPPASKRLRFEILKRDGFKCRYCGATAIESLLHVDHVHPKSEGGDDDPANLVTSCSSCNLGKSNIKLDDSRIQQGTTTEAMLEHAEQVGEYLSAVKVVEQKRAEVLDFLTVKWNAVNRNSLLEWQADHIAILARKYPLDVLIDAIEITGVKGLGATGSIKYLYGVLRNKAAGV